MAGLRREVVWEFDAQTKGMVSGLAAAGRALDGLKDEANSADRALRDIKDVNLDVSMDLNDLSVTRLKDRLLVEKRNLQAQISDLSVDIDTTQALAQLKLIDRQIRQIDGMNAKADVDIDMPGTLVRDVSTLKDQILNLGRALPLISNPAVAPVVAGLAAMAAGFTSLIGPGVMGGVAAAIGVGGAGGILYAYDQLHKGNTKIGEDFRELKKQAKGVYETIINTTGGILEEMIGKLNVKDAVSKAFKGVDSWVKQNSGTIEKFFIDVAKAVAQGTKIFATFAEHALPATGDAVLSFATALGRGASQVLRYMSMMLDGLAKFMDIQSAFFDLIPGMDSTADAFKGMANEARQSAGDMSKWADENDKFIEQTQTAWQTFKDTILPAAVDGLRNLSRQADKWWKDLEKQGKDQSLVLQVGLEQGKVREVKQTLDGLSKKRLAEIVSKTDKNSDNKNEVLLNKLARKRIAEIKAEAKNTNEVDKKLTDMSKKERIAYIKAAVNDSLDRVRDRLHEVATKERVATIAAQVGASVANTRENLDNVANKDRTATIKAVANVQGAIDAIQAAANRSYTAKVSVIGQWVGGNVKPQGGRSAYTLAGRSTSTATAAASTWSPSGGSTRTTPTVINVEVDGYRVARTVQRRFTSSGRVYV